MTIDRTSPADAPVRFGSAPSPQSPARRRADGRRTGSGTRTTIARSAAAGCDHDWVGWSGKVRCRLCGTTREL